MKDWGRILHTNRSYFTLGEASFLPTQFHGCIARLPGFTLPATPRLAVTEGQIDALDNCSIASDPLVVGDGQLLHIRRIHSHPARLSHHHGLDPCDPGSKSGGLKEHAVGPSLGRTCLGNANYSEVFS